VKKRAQERRWHCLDARGLAAARRTQSTPRWQTRHSGRLGTLRPVLAGMSPRTRS
jgi:hypothetical protein